MSPSVSIITPCYNAADTLPGTVASILAQDFDDWELLLVDDCSGDATEAVARGFAERDARVRYVRMVENGGAARARNRGIELARGRYIAFLDADDLWLPNKLSGQLAMMRERGWPLTFTAYHRVDGEERQLGRVGVPERVTYRQLLKTNYIGCSTAIYDSEALGKVLMPDIRRRQDFGLWLRLLKRTPYAYGIDRAWTRYRVRGQSLSANKTRSAGYNWRLYREVEGLSLPASLYYFAHYAVRGLLRSRLPGLARRLGWLS
ncbi:glycosyl transferase group 2 family protein [Alcanivorax sp. 521-1]|uniref:Glycosyl transferase group 2 family protein n=1 Tax=Alloalcanivorax profundimaris TaxID=2735259 RepID=A0ABS0AR30_9GAMM|nr:glycosyltransferase family 2 protein [Alloalcanivorax profundimaris]MBF5056597.1 glycosyl transferase group 2 family protein [Alloalcanivorax profundimaris]